MAVTKSNGVRVCRSPIAGKGLFATKNYKRGDILCKYTGKVVDAGYEHRNRYLVEIDDNKTLDGSSMSNIGRWANHCCKPNAKLVVGNKCGWIVASRRIRRGDEITLHYGGEYMTYYIKDCKCSHCLEKRSMT